MTDICSLRIFNKNILKNLSKTYLLSIAGLILSFESTLAVADEFSDFFQSPSLTLDGDFSAFAKKYGLTDEPLTTNKVQDAVKVTSPYKEVNKSHHESKSSTTDTTRSPSSTNLLVPVSDEVKYTGSQQDYNDPAGLYLRNIPVDSSIKFSRDFMLLPRESTAYFQGGERVYGKPSVVSSEPASFCMLNFTESGKGRRASKQTTLYIQSVDSMSTDFVTDEQKTTNITLTKMLFDHDELKRLLCVSTSSEHELTIRDLFDITGGLLKVEVQSYIDI